MLNSYYKMYRALHTVLFDRVPGIPSLNSRCDFLPWIQGYPDYEVEEFLRHLLVLHITGYTCIPDRPK